MTGVSRWFQSLPAVQQLIVLALVFEPIGAASGYLLGPSVGLDPLAGAAGGALVGSIPVSLWGTTKTS